MLILAIFWPLMPLYALEIVITSEQISSLAVKTKC